MKKKSNKKMIDAIIEIIIKFLYINIRNNY